VSLVAAQVAVNSSAPPFQARARSRRQDVAGGAEAHLQPGTGSKSLAEAAWPQLLSTAAVLLGVQRQRGWCLEKPCLLA
jgi:hypothetical protein